MQPTQLSLMPEQVPAPPRQLLAQLPAEQVAAAVGLLARLLATAATGRQVAADD